MVNLPSFRPLLFLIYGKNNFLAHFIASETPNILKTVLNMEGFIVEPKLWKIQSFSTILRSKVCTLINTYFEALTEDHKLQSIFLELHIGADNDISSKTSNENNLISGINRIWAIIIKIQHSSIDHSTAATVTERARTHRVRGYLAPTRRVFACQGVVLYKNELLFSILDVSMR